MSKGSYVVHERSIIGRLLKVCYILIKHMKLNMAWAERASSDNLETL